MSSAKTNLNVLFVCTGNICRSPMADQILEQLAKKHNLPLSVSSAGVAAMTGEPMTRESAESMAQRGYKPGPHKARDLAPQLLNASDLVITMTLDHRSDIARMLPKASRYSFTLDEFARLASFLMNDPQYSEEFKKKPKETRAQYLARVFKEATLLRGMVPTGEEPRDVIDPYGESLEIYTQVAEQIDEMIKVVVEFFSR